MLQAAAFSATISFACFLVATNNTFLPEAAIFFKASLASSISSNINIPNNSSHYPTSNNNNTTNNNNNTNYNTNISNTIKSLSGENLSSYHRTTGSLYCFFYY